MSMFKPRMREPNFLFSVIMTTAKMLFIVMLIIGVAGGGALMGVAKAWVETAPQLDLSAFDEQAKTSFIYDKYNNLITDFKGTENRIDAEWSEIPENLKNAVIAIEDKRFYTHNGVDVKRILGAFIGNLLNNDMQGGSTITQQLVKLTMLTSEQNYKRKLQEAYLALHLEEQLSKEEILLEYLNVIYLGGSNYGVKVAALDYFGKDVEDLSLRECAALARTIRNPYRYNLRSNYYSRNTPEVIEEGADYVLSEMYAQGLITVDEYNQAMSERLNVLETSTFTNTMYDNAYYVEYAIYDVVTKMLRVENLSDTTANRSAMESRLRTGGYSIYTCLDPTVQQAVQDVVTNYSNYPETRNASDSYYRSSLGNGEYLRVVNPQAAVAVIDWHTGELTAIIGGRSEPIQRKQLNRASYGGMPVGSSLKPLSVYGPAIDLGNSPGSPVINAGLKIEGWDTQRGYPNNFGTTQFNGIETMRRAIMKSHNTAAAQALFSYVGIENSVNYLLKLGISSSRISATGSGLALGSSGVSMIELAGGFAAIANKGKYLEPYAFTKVLNSDGSTYIDISDEQIQRQVFKESTAYMLVDMLEGCVSDNGTGSRAKFGNFTIAGKTGTNSDYRGVTFAGMTAYYACAVWIGCDNYKPLTSDATGGTYAAPFWAAVMSRVHSILNITRDRAIITGSAEDYGLVVANACAVSGMKPTAACRNDVNGYGITTDYYLHGTEPTEKCNMHRTIQLCTKSQMLPSSSCTSVKSYGTIYLPEGHPLRYDTIENVREYFKGASTDKLGSSLGVCTQCGSNRRATTTTYVSTAALDEATQTTRGIISQAQSVISLGGLTQKQTRNMNNLITKAETAISNGNLKNIRQYGKQIQQYIKKVS
ncbi:MAG: transglycosylase domain-containing protein [Clostridia bacterium]|nr:transglycosylase domain-containing protein [Clostridia bacterium]